MRLKILLTMLAIVALGGLDTYLSSKREKIFQHDVWVARNQGFLMGCMFATKMGLHLDNDDPMFPVYQEFCVKNGMAVAKETEPQ